MTLQEKHEKLKSLFREMGSVAVAYSGGVDSALVLAVAHSVLNGKNAGGDGKLGQSGATGTGPRPLNLRPLSASNTASSTRKKSPRPTTPPTRSTDAITANRNCIPNCGRSPINTTCNISSTAPTWTIWGITVPAWSRRAKPTCAVRCAKRDSPSRTCAISPGNWSSPYGTNRPCPACPRAFHTNKPSPLKNWR